MNAVTVPPAPRGRAGECPSCRVGRDSDSRGIALDSDCGEPKSDRGCRPGSDVTVRQRRRFCPDGGSVMYIVGAGRLLQHSRQRARTLIPSARAISAARWTATGTVVVAMAGDSTSGSRPYVRRPAVTSAKGARRARPFDTASTRAHVRAAREAGRLEIVSLRPGQ